MALRIWDLPPSYLCRQHLLGEHRELHAVWSILVHNKKGYAGHPETVRWRGKLAALYRRHADLVLEMSARGYRHRTPLDWRLAKGLRVQVHYVNSPAEQREILRKKKCGCGKRRLV